MSDKRGQSTDGAAPVLIVDDNAGKRLALKAALASLDLDIVEADSGIAALRCVASRDFAVILLDVRMPVMDGLETAALIRRRQQSEMTPIIFVTAHENDEIVHTNGYAQGAVDFISAPVSPAILRAKVSVFTSLFIRAEELARRAHEVQASADRLRLLTDAAPIGIFQTDAENRYLYTNPRWSEITGVPPAQAVGQPWDIIVAADQRAALVAELNGAARYQSEICIRLEMCLPHAQPRMVLLTSKSIADGAGRSTGWVGTLSDITAEVDFEAAMAHARDEATEASRLKSDFLANMSHEIRTPMNGVIGMTDLLLETELDDHQRDYAQTVRNSGDALLTIINDILDFSKVEAGKLDIEDIDFDVRRTVTNVVDLLAGPAQTKGLELVAIVEDAVPDMVTGDPGRVRQVLTNLIGNALKFTHIGEVVVRVSAAEDVDTSTLVRFEVSDTGDGIAADKLGLVFQPFVQADTSTSRRYGGTGLGLAISGDLVALMGGESGVTSELGAGSTFWFTIHVRTDAVPADPDPTPADDLAHTGILIVDNNAAQLGVLVELVTGWGMTAGAADSGQTALDMMRMAVSRGQPFPVVLIDRYMPGMDGLVLKDAILIDPALTPEMVLLNDLVHGDPGVIVVPGIIASLSKPVHPDELRHCLRVALGLAAADAGAPPRGRPTSDHFTRVAATPSASPATAGEGDLGRLLVAEDNLINQKVAVAMLSGAGYRVDTVLNGIEAVRAVAAQPYDAVLMDCQMPELNGYEATAAIRSLKSSGRFTPIIAMTAGARAEDRERCLAEGMDSYLAKPVSKDALLALVARSVKSGTTMDVPQLRDAERSSDGAPIDRVVFDELRVLGDAVDHDFIADLVDEFMKNTEPLLIELRQAMAMGDALTVGRIAHSIKGSSVQLGGRRLAISCSRLEETTTTDSLGNRETDLQELEFDYLELCRALTQLTSVDHQRSGGSRV
jgi:two-component system, sensor histidine kinase and response regulator